MAQKLRDDKIGILSHSAGNITMAASMSNPAYLTIGGQQYKITSNLVVALPAMSANTRYQVFAVLNAGVVELRISQNENSIGPAGFTRWKLVGSLYSNGVGGIAFGGFVNIKGVPQSDTINYTPTGNFTNNVGYVGKWHRVGKFLIGSIDMTFSGVPSPSGPTNFSMPLNQLIDLAGMADGGNGARQVVGHANFFDNGQANYVGRVGVSSNALFLIGATNVSATFGTNLNGTETQPFSINNTDSISAEVIVPVVGWSNVAIEDL